MGRRRRSCAPSVPGLQDFCDIIGRPASPAHLDQGANDAANHRPQEAIGRNVEMDTIARLLPGRCKEVTRPVFPFGGGHTERGEVVVAKQPGSGILHGLKIEPRADAQGILTTYCTASVFNPINVLSPSGIPTGVKS